MPTELNPTNAFGELLLDLLEAQYGDLDAGIQALVASTGLSEEEVTSIISGDDIVEDENLLSSIIDAFPDADDDDLEVIINVATSVESEDRDELIQKLESDEGVEYPMDQAPAEPPMDEEEAAYARQEQEANFMNTQRLNELEQQLASFQYENEITSRLTRIDSVAGQYVNNEVLPPSYKTLLIGNFSDEKQRLVEFANIATKNNVDIPTMLFATEFALKLLADASEFVEFKDMSVSDEDMAIAQFSASLDQIVQQDYDAIFSN